MCELIETLWNVNLTVLYFSMSQSHELIETLWNVNLRMSYYLTSFEELIETLWNVNKYCIAALTNKLSELIETLWNVNLSAETAIVAAGVRINRNIVECKLRTQRQLKRRMQRN